MGSKLFIKSSVSGAFLVLDVDRVMEYEKREFGADRRFKVPCEEKCT
jgi:hypothetical protein